MGWTAAVRRGGVGGLRLLLAALAVTLSLSPGAAPAQGTDEDPAALFFLTLEQLQQANLGVSQQMSETQIKAAERIEDALLDGRISKPAEQRLAEALVANARMLASITYSPLAARDEAGGDTLVALIDRNLLLVRQLQTLVGASPGFRAAVSDYAALQLQTQDLALALRNGWARYDEALAAAEAQDLLPDGAFDPATREWTLQFPAVLPAVGEPVPLPAEEIETPVAAGSPPGADTRVAETPDEGLDGETVPVPEISEDDPLLAAIRNAPVVTDPPPEAEPLAEVPAGADVPAVAEAPAVADVSVPEPAEDVTAGLGGGTERLQPGDPFFRGGEATDTIATASDSWTVGVEGGRPVAIAKGLGEPDSTPIRELRIGCSPNGTLRYTVVTDTAAEQFYVFVDETRGAEVGAEAGRITGNEAIRMSDALRLAFEVATGTSGTFGRIAIAPSEVLDRPAYLPVLGYLEARGSVLDGCEPYPAEEDIVAEDVIHSPPTGALVPDPASEPAATSADESEPILVDSQGDGEAVAPIPYPRPTRRGAIDLLVDG